MVARLNIDLLLMRKLYWIVSLIVIISALFIFQVLPSLAADDGLMMFMPTTCPATGCAAGQRLNFRIQYSVAPQSTDPNTQVCVYAPTDGQSSEGNSPWAIAELGWISEVGMVSGEAYMQGQVDTLCDDHLNEDDEWLIGAYAQLQIESTDELEFALHIHPEAEIDGYIKVKVIEAETENGSWIETASYSTLISVAQSAETVYIAQTPDDCGSYQPCFVNSADDLKDGLGTGLRDAVMAVDADHEIRILKDYTIKVHGVMIDKQLTIMGHENAMITYPGALCTNPMLKMTNGGTLSELTINDGNCITPSRNLVEVNSTSDVVIKQNTLTFGNHAVEVHDNTGDVTIAFNHIANNDEYTIFRKDGNNTGNVNIYANNIVNNRMGYQVHCSGKGVANHNFWGQGRSATNNAAFCSVTNAKQLGASIQLAADKPGVQALRQPVTSQMSYAFEGKIGARRSSGEDFDIIIVNHGKGLLANIPFYQTGSAQVQPCSNYYDVFIADGAAASDLILAFRYDLNSSCVTEIESQDYCGGTDSENYPLWWYDPGANVTDGWDRTGQNPQGSGAGGASGQETTCHLDLKEIRVNIDNTGRPSISSDLNFTPFVVGLPIIDGITLSEFTAQFDGSKINLRWITTREINVKGFYILRGNTETGVYTRISSLINAIGDSHIGGTYQFTDETITFARTYYYKIEVIDKSDNSIATHGPLSILTATATPTATLTRTPTTVPTATNTPPPYPIIFITPTPFPIVYRTPTPLFRHRTATPSGGPTQIRTYGPSPTGIVTVMPYPVTDQTPDFEEPTQDPGYPIEWEEPPPIDAYPPPDTADPSPTPSTEPDMDDIDRATPEPGGIDDEDELPIQDIRWIFIIVGVAGGLSLIGAISVILARSRLM